MNELPHHIVIVDPQHEKLAASHLKGRGIACYLPLEPAYRTRGARRRPMLTQVPIFKGYLFVQADQNYHVTPKDTVFGARRLMARDSVPLVLPPRWMGCIREIERKLQSPGAPFKPKDPVRVLTGIFGDQIGEVDTCDREFLMVLLNMLGRKVRTRIDIFDVELVR